MGGVRLEREEREVICKKGPQRNRDVAGMEKQNRAKSHEICRKIVDGLWSTGRNGCMRVSEVLIDRIEGVEWNEWISVRANN